MFTSAKSHLTLDLVECERLNGHSGSAFSLRVLFASQKDDFHGRGDDVFDDGRGVQMASTVENDSVYLQQLVA